MASPLLIIKPSALQKHLQSNPDLLSTLRSSSCLLVTSAPSQHNDKKSQHQPIDTINNHIQSTTSFLTGRYNLRTSTPLTISSAYPTTPVDVNRAHKMMSRVGSDVVIGIGSGSAIDLAKSLSFGDGASTGVNDLKEMILVPSTCGAAMAAGSDLPLLLDEKEEMLLPPQSSSSLASDDKNDNDIHKTIIIDTKAAVVPTNISQQQTSKSKLSGLATPQDVAYASLAICLDTALAMDENHHAGEEDDTIRSVMTATLNQSLSILRQLHDQQQQQQQSSMQQDALEVSFNAGQLISFGNSGSLSSSSKRKRRRTIPLALASALLPQYFPKGNLVSFYASLFHGLCATVDDISVSSSASSFSTLKQISDLILSYDDQKSFSKLAEWSDEMTRDSTASSCTALASLAMDTPTVHEMMKKMDANNTLIYDCVDADDEILERVLHYSLNR